MAPNRISFGDSRDAVYTNAAGSKHESCRSAPLSGCVGRGCGAVTPMHVHHPMQCVGVQRRAHHSPPMPAPASTQSTPLQLSASPSTQPTPAQQPCSIRHPSLLACSHPASPASSQLLLSVWAPPSPRHHRGASQAWLTQGTAPASSEQGVLAGWLAGWRWVSNDVNENEAGWSEGNGASCLPVCAGQHPCRPPLAARRPLQAPPRSHG